MRTQGLFMSVLLLLMVAASCSKEKDEVSDNYTMTPPKEANTSQSDESSKYSVNAPSMECNFRGVWTVDDVSADTVDVNVRTGVNIIDYGVINTVAFYGFPYREMTKKILPDVNIAKITTSMIVGGPLPADEAMLLEAIIAHGDNYNCMQNCESEEYRCIGLSENAIYLELKPGQDYAVQYLPWVVTTVQGDMFPMVAAIVPDKSTATLDTKGETFSSTLTVSQVEYKAGGETVIKKLNPEIKLKYTSIEKIALATLGN